MNTLLSAVFDVVAPPTCLACREISSESLECGLCGRCSAALSLPLRPVPSPDSVVRCWAMGEYGGVLGQLIRAAKYHRSLAAADQLGLWLGERVAGVIDVDAIVPIPIPWIRRMRRGFDQSDRLAQSVARESGLESLPLLFRKDASRQVGKGAAARRELSPNVFGVRNCPMPSRVLLVDDVLTTGATIHAASRQLQSHGVQAVWAAVVADSRA